MNNYEKIATILWGPSDIHYPVMFGRGKHWHLYGNEILSGLFNMPMGVVYEQELKEFYDNGKLLENILLRLKQDDKLEEFTLNTKGVELKDKYKIFLEMYELNIV